MFLWINVVALLVLSNIFMTYAWYGHLRDFAGRPLWFVIALSWGIAFFEYCLQVPANRLGATQFSLGQLKVMQEIVAMVVFLGFSYFYMKRPFDRDTLYATLCLVMAAYFVFRKASPPHNAEHQAVHERPRV